MGKARSFCRKNSITLDYFLDLRYYSYTLRVLRCCLTRQRSCREGCNKACVKGRRERRSSPLQRKPSNRSHCTRPIIDILGVCGNHPATYDAMGPTHRAR